MKRIALALTVVLAAAFGASAQGTDEPVASGSGLTGSQWQLVSMEAGGVVAPVILEGEVTLDFASESEVSGSGGCNMYSGGFTAADGTISFSPFMSTKMACADDRRTAQEANYVAAMALVTRYQLSAGRLTLSSDEGTVLRFTARGAYGLVGSQWALDAYGTADAETAVIGDVLLTLDVVNAHEMNAFGGCNSMGSTYSAEEETITIEPGVGTLIACADVINTQEAAYFSLLPTAVRYELSGDRLTLWSEDGQMLRFTATGNYALWRTTWRLDSMLVEGDMAYVPIEGSEITLEFNSDGTMGGLAGCNHYGGNYVIDGITLTFSDIVSTLMACVDEPLMAQETMYLSAIEGVTGFALVDGRLKLMTTDGTLTFVPAGGSVVPNEV